MLGLDLGDMRSDELIRSMSQKPQHAGTPVVVYTPGEVSSDEDALFAHLTQSLVVKQVRSSDRLVDETALFLHRRIPDMPEAQRRMVELLHRADAVLAGKKVLIVDDDIRNIFAMTTVLEARHMNTLSAETGRIAIELLDRTPDIDIVLMDIMMPEMDGYDTMRAIRAQRAFRSLPIIAVTAKAYKGDREKCFEAGATDYISKPVDPDQLVAMLRVWLHR